VADFIKFLARFIGNETDGKSLNINFTDEISGQLTVNLGLISVDEDSASAVVNIRYPVNIRYEDIMENILKVADDKKISVSVMRHKMPLYIEKGSKLITTLMESYARVMGEKAYTIAIGGQTYAKAFNNMAAFGPVFPGKVSCAHMPDEYIDIDDLMKCAKIYGRAVYELSK
jgi:succinyl-diaminopimelate desuccinylase